MLLSGAHPPPVGLTHRISDSPVYAAAITAIVQADSLWLRMTVAGVTGLIQFRVLALFHAHLHRALLWNSTVAQWLFRAVGLCILIPREVWLQTHNFHHINNGKIDWTAIGSFQVWTRDAFEKATPRERRAYLVSRHPLALLFGYFVVGIGGMCVQGFVRSPKKNWTGPLALLVHFGVFALLCATTDVVTALLIWILPCVVNHAMTAYLFYAQHNFPGTRFFVAGSWDYVEAAVVGSSYFRMGHVMRWLTADIGYHHVHHLNHRIPTYRLAEAMAAIPELQNPTVTTWHPRDVVECLRLAVWNPTSQRMEPL